MSARRRWIRASVAVSVVLGLGGAGAGLSYTPIFDAEQVLVRGAVHLPARHVRRISGLTVGTNVLHADLHAATSRLEENGWIAEASARRELPSTIVIEVRERIPVGRMTFDGERGVVMDDGTVIPGVTLPRLPRIWVSSASLSDPSVSDAAAALGALSDRIHAEVTAAAVRTNGSLFLQLDRGVAVAFGPAEELEQKALALAELLRWADENAVPLAAVDVTVPQAPTARVLGDTSTEP
jgi:cell division protein FtsQ